MKKPTITICSSADFYKTAVEIQDQLSDRFEIIVPKTATLMRASGDYDISHYKTWFADPSDYHKKAALMRAHFREVVKADAILVINETKHGRPGYIGGNVLMEMALAFWSNLPIYVLNQADPASPYIEEIAGMGSIILDGDLSRLATDL